MSDGYRDTLGKLRRVFETLRLVRDAMGSHDGGWNYTEEKVVGYIEGLFSRAPWQPGDRAVLTQTPEINEKDSWGWMGSKHFLVEGRVGTIRYTDFRDGRFTALWEPDNQTYISSFDEQEHPVSEPALYGFSERFLRKVEK